MQIDLPDLSKLTVMAYLTKRGKPEMAEYIGAGLEDASARGVADAILGHGEDARSMQVADSLLGLAAERINRTAGES